MAPPLDGDAAAATRRGERPRGAAGGSPITSDALDALLQRFMPAIQEARERDGLDVTYFEVLTALALHHFAESGVEYTILEAGLGGAHDATNVFEPAQVRRGAGGASAAKPPPAAL